MTHPDLSWRTCSGQERVAVVVNARAGALLDAPDPEAALAGLLRGAGLAPEFIAPAGGTVVQRMELAVRSGCRLIVIAGGDGTIGCAAQLLTGTDLLLGILPLGTMNILAKDLGIPTGDLEAAVRVLASGQVRAVDVGEVNGRYFVCGSMLGLPSRLARFREATRGRLPAPARWLRYVLFGLRAMASGRRLRVVLRIEQRAHRIRACTLIVTPNPIDDTSEHFRGRSCLDGGTLAVYLVRSLGPLALLRLALRWLGGHWREDPLIQEYRTRRCAILARARTLKVTNDGEVQSMTPPLCYRIHPRALRVVVPRDPPSETR